MVATVYIDTMSNTKVAMETAGKAQRILRSFASIHSLYADITSCACFFELQVRTMLQFVYEIFREPAP